MKFKKPRLLLSAFLVATSVNACFDVVPAQAQYGYPYGYLPFIGGNSWLYLARSLVNPGNMLWRGGYGYNAGGYLANSLMWNAAYAAGQGINNVQRRNQINNYYGQQAIDQVSPAKWAYPQLYANQQNQQNMPVIPGQSQGIQGMQGTQEPDPLFAPIPANIGNGGYQPVTGMPNNTSIAPSGAMPGNVPGGGYQTTNPSVNPFGNQYMNQYPAPGQYGNMAGPAGVQPGETAPGDSGRGKNKKKKYKSQRKMPDAAPSFQPTAGQTAPSAVAPQKSSPFVQAFVDHVNGNFSGDIGKALSDKETRGYAKAVGLIDSEDASMNLPQDRIDLIHQIMSDPSEDAATKINTVRLLLRHGK